MFVGHHLALLGRRGGRSSRPLLWVRLVALALGFAFLTCEQWVRTADHRVQDAAVELLYPRGGAPEGAWCYVVPDTSTFWFTPAGPVQCWEVPGEPVELRFLGGYWSLRPRFARVPRKPGP